MALSFESPWLSFLGRSQSTASLKQVVSGVVRVVGFTWCLLRLPKDVNN